MYSLLLNSEFINVSCLYKRGKRYTETLVLSMDCNLHTHMIVNFVQVSIVKLEVILI